MNPITRAEAIQKGQTWYFTKPCKYGHMVKRFVANRACSLCCLNLSNKTTDYVRKKKRDRKYLKRYYRTHKTEYLVYVNERRANKKRATPPWYKNEKDAITHLYAKARELTRTTGIQHNVDHIVPFTHPLVCGLHCLANLRILTEQENKAKHNTFEI